MKIRKGVLLWKSVLDAILQWKNYFRKSYFEAICFEENCSGISVVLHLGHMFWPWLGDLSLDIMECVCGVFIRLK